MPAAGFTMLAPVVRDLAEPFLNFAANVAGGAFYAVLIHGRFLHSAVNLPRSTKVP